jgi:predicted O-methyltransferase YrrM
MKTILNIPILGTIILFFYRLKIVAGFQWAYNWLIVKWLFSSRETTNFTFDLDDYQRAYLIDFVAIVTNKNVQEIENYLLELEQDKTLATHILTKIQAHPERYKADRAIRYGKRLAWYAIIRAIKPKIVIETGVDKGLGAVVICAALLKNKAEGQNGRYFGTDINPKAGYLLENPYQEVGEILLGDSVQSLEKFDKKIDLFINDSDHSADYEMREYQAIKDKLAENAYLLGDNSDVTDKLHQFARQSNRKFLFYKEVAKNHWYQGGGVGVCW